MALEAPHYPQMHERLRGGIQRPRERRLVVVDGCEHEAAIQHLAKLQPAQFAAAAAVHQCAAFDTEELSIVRTVRVLEPQVKQEKAENLQPEST